MRTSDVHLYAVRTPNQTTTIVYHPNAYNEDKEDVSSGVSNMPVSNEKNYQLKYYGEPVTIGVGEDGTVKIPTRPDVTNKGQRYMFIGWNTLPDPGDGEGLLYSGGSSFNYNASPDYPKGEGFKTNGDKTQVIINLYAVWVKGEDIPDESKDEKFSGDAEHIRYIAKGYESTLTENSKWRSAERYKELTDSLNSTTPKSSYDYKGNRALLMRTQPQPSKS